MIVQRGGRPGRSLGHDHLAARQPFGDEPNRRVRRGNRSRELLDEHLLGDPIDRVDRVPFLLASDTRQRAHRRLLARRDDVAADASMQGLDGREERVRDVITIGDA